MLNLEALKTNPLRRSPFDFIVAPGFLGPQDAAAVRADFPRIDQPGLFPLSALSCGPRFAAMIDELHSPAVSAAFSELFGVDLSGHPLMVTVRGHCGAKDGRIHTDSLTKIVSALLYFNDDWSDTGGRLRLLNSADLEDYAEEVAPDDGTLIAFIRSDRSFHGHRPHQGQRRCLQFNWMTDQATMEHELGRHRWSARTKKLRHAVGSLLGSSGQRARADA
jgi:hypothetical protein